MTNETRANRGIEALETHKKLIGDEGAEFSTAVADLFTDLLHAARLVPYWSNRPRYTRDGAVYVLQQALLLAEINFREERG